MLSSFPDPAAGVPEPPGDFESNYRNLKQLIDRALKDGAPLEDLHLITKVNGRQEPRKLSREDLLGLLRIIRRIKARYGELLQCPVPKELERDILEKAPHERLPWETEALEKIARWRSDVASVRAEVRKELNDQLTGQFFQEI